MTGPLTFSSSNGPTFQLTINTFYFYVLKILRFKIVFKFRVIIGHFFVDLKHSLISGSSCNLVSLMAVPICFQLRYKLLCSSVFVEFCSIIAIHLFRCCCSCRTELQLAGNFGGIQAVFNWYPI